MKGSYPLNTRRLHGALFELLQHSETTLSFGSMVENRGRVRYSEVLPPTGIEIHVDANHSPLNHLATILHELVHVILAPILTHCLAEDVEEPMVLALEQHVYEYVTKSRSRRDKWTKLIASKLQRKAAL